MTSNLDSAEQTQYYARDPLKKVLARTENIIANCETFRLVKNKAHGIYEMLVVDSIRSNACAEVMQGGHTPKKLLNLSLENMHRLNELGSMPFPIELQCHLSLNRVNELMSGIVEYYSGQDQFKGDYQVESDKAKSTFEAIAVVLNLIDEIVVSCLLDLDRAFDLLEKLTAANKKMEEIGNSHDFLSHNSTGLIIKP